MIENREIADQIRKIGFMLELVDSNPFKIKAFYTAANNVEECQENIY